ncbi:PTS glucitol/sorbitol transporter subunit IIA [Metabacillus arenae]|uniref:PTS glucitol/sorbitol transporter subunit IIA n=1 Tax=Metabacillus arenae TaxID=2771434 RepID=A0A926NE09_9BACI|nr:PTS glucitol/sorbitol transporter subunit IIA [Metabacillus arenae]MBD1379511.1 PTS glucitol/sorbitol transporter subunit IIA [Metabacillus arenae]
MQTIYETKVNKIGSMVSAFLEDKMLILFGENAPAELTDYCLSINVKALADDIHNGDVLVLGDKEYRITAVGSAVKQNLSSLGHITLKFDGSESPELPGTLYLESKDIKEVEEGDLLQVVRK